MSYFSFASKVKWSLRKKKKSHSKSIQPPRKLRIEVKRCTLADQTLQDSLTARESFGISGIRKWIPMQCYHLRRVNHGDSQILKIGHPPGTTSWKRATCWRGKKYITLQLSNTRQLLESSSPKLFFFFYSESKMNAVSSQSTNGLFFSPHIVSLPPPEIWSKGLQRLQEPLHAITSQTRRWQLRQGLMQSDIIACGLERSSCLQPLLIVAVIR